MHATEEYFDTLEIAELAEYFKVSAERRIEPLAHTLAAARKKRIKAIEARARVSQAKSEKAARPPPTSAPPTSSPASDPVPLDELVPTLCPSIREATLLASTSEWKFKCPPSGMYSRELVSYLLPTYDGKKELTKPKLNKLTYSYLLSSTWKPIFRSKCNISTKD